MSSLNSVTLCGNLGRDPETRFSASGAAVCNFSLATTSYRKDANGERQELTQWHRCVAYQRTAEIAQEHLKTGSKALIQGKLNYREYTDKDGVKKHLTEIIVDNLVLLGEKTRAPMPPPARPRQEPSTTSAGDAARRATPQRTAFDDMDDDIPF